MYNFSSKTSKKQQGKEGIERLSEKSLVRLSLREAVLGSWRRSNLSSTDKPLSAGLSTKVQRLLRR